MAQVTTSSSTETQGTNLGCLLDLLGLFSFKILIRFAFAVGTTN